jgi:nucleoside 2-deoxyribosyltransferase
MTPQIYLAGPEVFMPFSQSVGQRKKEICASYGYVGLYPGDLDSSFEPCASPEQAARQLFLHCIAMMDQCDFAIANLTPFRGVSMDVGTAVEIGYMYSAGKPVFGYSNSIDDYSIRVARARLASAAEYVEDFGLADNLMCEMPIRSSGAPGVVRRMVAEDQLFTDLTAFEQCVANAG